MSATTELIVAGGTAIAGGALTPLLGKKEPHWRLLAIPGPSHRGYWRHQITYKVQRKFLGMWYTRHKSKIQTDRDETFWRDREAVINFLQAKIDGDFRADSIIWDSRLDDIGCLGEMIKDRT